MTLSIYDKNLCGNIGEQTPVWTFIVELALVFCSPVMQFSPISISVSVYSERRWYGCKLGASAETFVVPGILVNSRGKPATNTPRIPLPQAPSACKSRQSWELQPFSHMGGDVRRNNQRFAPEVNVSICRLSAVFCEDLEDQGESGGNEG